ncbi:MAG: S-layer homology domain-containing protein, partial [Actinomycetota bacterium]
DPVTRGQMAAFLHRALGDEPASGEEPEFTDTAGTVFAEDIAWLADSGITRGCNPPDNDRYCPGDPVTRGQMAAFLHRALGD